MVDRRRLAALGQPPERLEDQPAHGIELLVAEVALERLVEVSDFGLRLDPVAAISLGDDVVFRFVEIVLILDVADDLFEHVLDRHEAGHAAVFIDDDRDVVAIGAEIAQQHVQPLGFRDEHDWA